MEHLTNLIIHINEMVWNTPLILLILGCGLWLTLRTGFIQLRKLPLALRCMVQNEKDGQGEVSSFGALCTALSATIGTGNIIGVAVAISAGGPGALLWMEAAALLGMAIKYSEGLLSIKYRSIAPDGHVLGGPFYYIERGMGQSWKWLAKLFALFAVISGTLGIGTITQVNGITAATQAFFDPQRSHVAFYIGSGRTAVPITWTVIITGLVVTLCTALVVLGGIRRIAQVSQIIVPFMAVLYLALGAVILVTNLPLVPEAFVAIYKGALSPSSVAGGIGGYTMKLAVQMGVARGLFSNEAGLGSAPIASAAAKTNECVRQGLVAMTGTFLDTIIVCTLTGLIIIISGGWMPSLYLEGAEITLFAFQKCLPFSSSVSALLLALCLVFFAFTTILGWNYYCERSLEYLSEGNQTAVRVFRWVYILAVFAGPYLTVPIVWNLADIFNGLMAFPNLLALFALAGVVSEETQRYFRRHPKD